VIFYLSALRRRSDVVGEASFIVYLCTPAEFTRRGSTDQENTAFFDLSSSLLLTSLLARKVRAAIGRNEFTSEIYQRLTSEAVFHFFLPLLTAQATCVAWETF